MTADADQLLPVLRKSWSAETSGKWLPDNPALGQCNVTSLVIQDLFGGEILKTEAPGGWHFYTRIHGERYDLTASQFAAPIPYADIASSRDGALAGTRAERYSALKSRVDELHPRRERQSN